MLRGRMMLRELASEFFRNALSVGKLVGVLAIPLALLLTHVWYQYQVTRLGYEISEETRRHERLADRHRKLTIEYAVESRSRRVTQTAREEFGLRRLEPEQLVDVSFEGATPPEREALSGRGHAALGAVDGRDQ